MADLSAPYLNRSGTAALDEAVFGADWNGPLVHECVRAELNARRRGTASTLTRGNVRGGGVKPWRQKGTGRARAGSIRSPLWAGGGTVFGPSPRAYTVKVNRKVRRAALRSALGLHAGRGSLGMLDAGAFEAPRTKQAAEALGGSELARPTLVVVEDGAAAKSFRNLSGVEVRAPEDAGVADVVRAASLVLSDAALEHLTGLARKEPRGGHARAEEVAA